jgi:class 3 adenylate cyclase
MPRPSKFEFERSRGVVWVCDLAGTSKHLNDDGAVDALEAFLPRLHWIASVIVDAAGGEFIKWSGDGFLAWFPTPLFRQIGERATQAFEAIWHLTSVVNVTQLNVKTERKYQLCHGVTYEPDALLTNITYSTGHQTTDLTGRSVVLAFRLSSIQGAFPNITTHREVVEATDGRGPSGLHFKRWRMTTTDRLRYFKGERWGTSSIYTSSERKEPRRSLRSVVRKSKEAILKAETPSEESSARLEFLERFISQMLSGPDWCTAVVNDYTRFWDEEVLCLFKRLVPVLEKALRESRPPQDSR